jgi:CBS domain-containing protein
MQVKHILRGKGREVITISSDSTLSEAARVLARRKIGALVVCDPDGAIAGILSERDIVRAVSESSVNALAQPVGRRMTCDIVTCVESADIEDVMEMMTNLRVRHLPVMDGDELIGIVSIGDVVKSRIDETVREAESLREYIAAG